MKNITIAVFLLIISTIGNAQDKLSKTVFSDSVYIDSVEILDEKILVEIEKFYNKNKKSIDDKTYFTINITGFNVKDTNSFLLTISIGTDIENDLSCIKEGKSAFFRFNKMLVLIIVLDCKLDIFNRVNKKLFYFNRREHVFLLPTTKARYKVKKNKTSEILIRKLYYIKYPCTKIQCLYYNIFRLD